MKKLSDNMKIFGKNLKEYLWPIKFYLLGSILIVISQYTIALPFSEPYPFLLNLTQGLWALMVIFSVIKLVRKYDFGMKNVFVLGIFYSLIIHGLKISIRFFFYGKGIYYLLDRFLYGSFLVMIIVLVIGPIFIYFKKKKLL